MNYSLLILPSARKSMARLPKPQRQLVDRYILALGEDPRPAGAIPLKGQGRGLWRLRVGDYRILYQIRSNELTVVIVDVGHRRDVYRGL